jgi:hypothetical protein
MNLIDPQVRTQPSKHALYYPYIHIRDQNWLKATLLTFRQVKRMVPREFVLRDYALVKDYLELEGPVGPLLDSANLYSPRVQTAYARLAKLVETNGEYLQTKYSKAVTAAEFLSGPKAFQIHRYKIVDPHLFELLDKHKLFWYSREQTEADWEDWITVNPKVGAAIMSTLALAVGVEEGLDVVTPSALAHDSLLAHKEDDVFDALLGLEKADFGINAGVAPEELAQVVVSLSFDFTRLSAQNIKDLLCEGKDLGRFLDRVSAFSQAIPPGLGEEERTKQVKRKAEEIILEWEFFRGTLPAFAREAIAEKSIEELPKKFFEAIPEIALGSVVTTAVAGIPGIAISLLTSAAVKTYQGRNGPYKFLNRIDKVQQSNIGNLYVPQWREMTKIEEPKPKAADPKEQQPKK